MVSLMSMKLITRDTDYAIRALLTLRRYPGKVVRVDLLVKQNSIPRPFMRKILQILNRNGIVHSYKGKGGGFTLARKGGTASVMDIITIFQGHTEVISRKFPFETTRTATEG
ncbi:MAG: Rrf2 family transcriptional regulator [Candidatus Omnitrophica bacterium]|nr:Rrf2 family transcriptional regulator [Candidatus Omnitrophota bacterium]